MSNTKKKWTYASSGVDIVAADHLVGKIARMVKGAPKTAQHRRVVSRVGGYASLFQFNREWLLAASTDGVGTKLKVAFELGLHHTVGIDLVAMSVNDLLCVGARPMFFLDYFATGKLKPKTAEKVLQGIVEGCRQAECPLVGGETAEMPGMYQEGEYDLAGFAVGWVETKKVLPKNKIRPGMVLIGVGSSGFHSNGFSLLRKWIPKGAPGKKIARQLLAPTKIYVRSLMPLIEKGLISGMAHITGSGFLNVPRISEDVDYAIQLPPLNELPPIIGWVKQRSELPLGELSQTFNMGIGLVLAVEKKRARQVLSQLKRSGERAWILGQTLPKKKKESCVLIQDSLGQSATLS